MSDLTKAQALAAYRRVCKRLNVEPMDAPVQQGDPAWRNDVPVLCEDYGSMSGTTRWAVVWEEGPYEWAHRAWEKEKSVFAEPIESFSLGLYPLFSVSY